MRPFNKNGELQLSPAEGGLRRQAVRGAGVTVLAQGAGFAVQTIATVALARLLAPADFGVVTMVTTFSVLIVSVGQIGFPEAVIQREEINHGLASNLFWINLVTSALLTLAFAGAGSLLAKFYHDPIVKHVAWGASLTIVITGASVMHLALLKRAMRFSGVSANDIIARAVSVGVSILLAWAGWGYWALVAGAVAQPVSTLIGAMLLCKWIPSFPRRVAGTGSMVWFALSVCARWSIGYFTQNTDNLLVGWRFGPVSLGLYKKAYDLFVFSCSFLNIYPVVVSTLSRLTKNPVQYRRYFLTGLSILAFVGMGLGADFTIIGGDVVRLVLGARWAESGRIFSLFGPGIGLMLIYSTHGMLYLSLGTTGRYFRWGLVECGVTCGLFLMFLHWGPSGIAFAWTLSYWVLTVPAFWYAGKPIDFGIKPFLGALWRYALASLLAGCACAAIIREIPFLAAYPGALGAAIRIFAISLIFAVLYLGAVVLFHGGFEPLYQFAGILHEVAPWRKFIKSSSVDTAADETSNTNAVLTEVGQ